MPRLTVTEYFVTKETGIQGSVSYFDLKGDAFAGGMFGKIYRATGVNGGNHLNGLAIKVFNQGSAPDLLRNVRHLQEVLNEFTDSPHPGEREIRHYPALFCIPLISFKGKLGNDIVEGYAANLVPSDRAMTYDELLSEHRDPSKPVKHWKLFDRYDRMSLAQQLVDGMSFLRSRGYIHADINPHNLLIEYQNKWLHLIDYDSGVVTSRTNDNPLTWGKRNDWVAPEVLAQLAKDPTKMVKVSLNTDVWAVAVGIHWMIFNQSPYFFLPAIKDSVLRAYQQKYTWPKFSKKDPMFAKPRDPAFLAHIERIALILDGVYKSDPVIETRLKPYFEITFQHGYFEPGRRTSYGQWNTALLAVLKGRPAKSAASASGSQPQASPRPQRTAQPAPGAAAAAPRPAAAAAPPRPAPAAAQPRTAPSQNPSASRQGQPAANPGSHASSVGAARGPTVGAAASGPAAANPAISGTPLSARLMALGTAGYQKGLKAFRTYAASRRPTAGSAPQPKSQPKPQKTPLYQKRMGPPVRTRMLYHLHDTKVAVGITAAIMVAVYFGSKFSSHQNSPSSEARSSSTAAETVEPHNDINNPASRPPSKMHRFSGEAGQPSSPPAVALTAPPGAPAQGEALPTHCQTLTVNYRWVAYGVLRVVVRIRNWGAPGTVTVDANLGMQHLERSFVTQTAMYATAFDFRVDPRYGFVPPTASCQPL